MNWQESEEYKSMVAHMDEKAKSIKKGENVLHVNYFFGILDHTVLSAIENELESNDIQLSSYDEAGDMKACLDDYQLTIWIALSSNLVIEIVKGSITSAAYDAIKFGISKAWKAVKDKSLTKYTSRSEKKQKMKFGLVVKTDENTSYNFHYNGKMSEEGQLKAIDKSFEFLEKQIPNTEYKLGYFIEFDEKTGEVVRKIDPLEEIRARNKKETDEEE